MLARLFERREAGFAQCVRSVLDQRNARRLFARRAETGATLLIITHDASLAARCERVLTMADGVIVSDTAGSKA